MLGMVSEEIVVNVPASEAWELYRSLRLAKLVEEKLPNLVQKIDVEEGDGGVGTVVKVTFVPGGGIEYHKEKFTVIDDERRVKEAQVVEGGYLDMGFTFYRARFEILEKDDKSCITRSTVEYELTQEAANSNANAASLVSVQPLLLVMQAAADYLTSATKH